MGIRRRWRRMREMRECMHVGPKLQAYLDGEVDEVDEATVRRVAAHLEYCRRCGLEAAAYREIKRALGAREQPAADALARLRAFGEQLAAAGPEPPADM